MASLASHAKRAAFQLGTTELYMESAPPRIAFVQLLLGRARSDALSFGDFSLCEQRKVARTLDASGKAQDAIRENKGAGFRLPPE